MQWSVMLSGTTEISTERHNFMCNHLQNYHLRMLDEASLFFLYFQIHANGWKQMFLEGIIM